MRCLAVLYGRRVRAVQGVLVFSVMTVDRNGAGRGLNFVVVNSDTKEVVRVARFDTFASGSYLSRRLWRLLYCTYVLLRLWYVQSSPTLYRRLPYLLTYLLT